MSEKNLAQIIMEWAVVFMRQSMHDFTRHAHSTGFSLAQMNVLFHLYYKGDSEVTLFADLMQVTPAAASQMVERMVKQGLARRAKTADDQRVRLVSLTEKGRAVVEESIAVRQHWMETLLAALNDQEKDVVARALSILTEKAGQLESAKSPRTADAAQEQKTTKLAR